MYILIMVLSATINGTAITQTHIHKVGIITLGQCYNLRASLYDKTSKGVHVDSAFCVEVK